MSGRKNQLAFAGFVLAASIFTATLVWVVLERYYSGVHFRAMGAVCQEIIDREPEAEPAVLDALKGYQQNKLQFDGENIIQAYGYRQADLWDKGVKTGLFFVVSSFAAGGILLFLAFAAMKKGEAQRINNLTEYLEKINTGRSGVLLQTGEDAFSKLQDEIYKTVTMLYETRERAIDTKNNFAENLANIAHQIKTPITALLLSTQMLGENLGEGQRKQIDMQLSRLMRLEEALLVLSRIDAGTLPLEPKKTDVFTALTLAADNLQELLKDAGVAVNIPEAGEVRVWADMDWTMEAMMNLMKNCMEHTAFGGTVFCAYEQNPLYTRIRIWDQGKGFAREDIPHLFERFYRGKQTNSSGIGIGLALAKAIIESQGGILSAYNRPEGGACFEIRLYCIDEGE